jgi:hypothetical protein
MDNFDLKKYLTEGILYKENQKLNLKDSLDSDRHHWPIPSEWFNKYYTIDFYPEGPRIFRNDSGEVIQFSDVIKHYENEKGSVTDLF